MIENATSDCRRDDGLVATVEDLDAELILELLDHRAERRLGDLTKVGGPPKVAELIQGLYILELLYIHKRRDISGELCPLVVSTKIQINQGEKVHNTRKPTTTHQRSSKQQDEIISTLGRK